MAGTSLTKRQNSKCLLYRNKIGVRIKEMNGFWVLRLISSI